MFSQKHQYFQRNEVVIVGKIMGKIHNKVLRGISAVHDFLIEIVELIRSIVISG